MLNLQCGNCGGDFEGEPNEAGELTCPHCNHVQNMENTDFELPQGFLIGGFEIIRLLGAGTSGKVYLATQLSMQRSVALKILLKEQTRDKAAIMRFLNEVKTLGAIQHQSIVTALDAGEDNGLYYLAMQYVAGDTMEHLIDTRGPIPEDEALEYSVTVAKALKYVWDKYRLFHKDIKPGNIMLDEDDEAVLLDLGIAQSRGDASVSGGHIEGSPYYMSPEQGQGQPLTWSTDLYSLGATLYHMIVGVPPYDDASDVMMIIQKHCSAVFPQPKDRNPNVKISSATVAVLQKMMAKKAADRYKSWDAFIADAEKTIKLFSDNTASIKRHQAKAQKKLLHKRPSSVPIKRKSNGAFVALLNLIIILLIGLAVAWYFVQKNNNEAAKKEFDKAVACAKHANYSPAEALEYLAVAKKLSMKFGVEESLKKEIAEAYDKVQEKATITAQEDAKAEELMRKVLEQFAPIKELIAATQNLVTEKLTDEGKIQEARNHMILASKLLDSANFRQEKHINSIEFAKKQLLQYEATLVILEKKMKKLEKQESTARELEAALEKETVAEKQKTVEEYKKEIAKYQKDIRKDLLIDVRKKAYDDATKLLQIPKNLQKEEDCCASTQEELIAWIRAMNSYLEKAKTVQLKLEDAKIRLKTTLDKNTLEMLEKAVKNNRNDLFAFFFLNGYFIQAKAFAETPADEKELSETAKVYLKWRIEQAIRQKENGLEQALERLDRDYRKLPEYMELRKTYPHPILE